MVKAGTHYQQTAQWQFNRCNKICDLIRLAGTVWPLCRDSVGVSQAQQICGGSTGRRDSAERNSTRKGGSSKARQRNYSVKKLWCPVDTIHISCLLSNCAFIIPHNGKCLAKLKKEGSNLSNNNTAELFKCWSQNFYWGIFKNIWIYKWNSDFRHLTSKLWSPEATCHSQTAQGQKPYPKFQYSVS